MKKKFTKMQIQETNFFKNNINNILIIIETSMERYLYKLIFYNAPLKILAQYEEKCT